MTKQDLKRACAVAAAALLTACASAPKNNTALEDARTTYERATSNPQVARSAAIELQKAQSALQQAESALQAGADPTTVEHYAYLAKRRSEAALETARIAAADESVRAARAERERIVLESRTIEADAQRQRAQQSLAAAEAARRLAEEQQAQAEAERRRAEAARTQAQAADARAAQQLAQAQSARAAATAAEERAKKLAQQLEQLQAKKTDRGMVLTLSDVLFDTGQSDLKPGAQRTLDQLATFLRENPERTVVIEGHTDSVGSAQFNQTLSERRALSVKHELVHRGINPDRISARGFGAAMPLVSNDTPAGRQQNRRVEIVLPDVG